MKFSAAILAAALAFAAPAFAGDEVMAEFYGNTVDINVQDAWHGKLMINADHTYAMTGDNGPSKGTWKMDGDKFCFTQVEPAPDAAATTCSPWTVARKVGDTWENLDSNGIQSSLSLVKGRS